MSRQEIIVTPFGEMMDMIACLAIYEGRADQKIRRPVSYDEAISMR